MALRYEPRTRNIWKIIYIIYKYAHIHNAKKILSMCKLSKSIFISILLLTISRCKNDNCFGLKGRMKRREEKNEALCHLYKPAVLSEGKNMS